MRLQGDWKLLEAPHTPRLRAPNLEVKDDRGIITTPLHSELWFPSQPTHTLENEDGHVTQTYCPNFTAVISVTRRETTILHFCVLSPGSYCEMAKKEI